ncbi:MAG: GtrA family protein [Bacteroidota bacterium]|nr:GtrA family protein [Bacteroidota bacterium]
MNYIDLLFKFFKFGVVGFSGVFVDFGITYLLKEKIKVQKYFSNAIGFIAAASTNYYLNRVWTFQSANSHIVVEYGKFVLISIIGLAINTFIIWRLTVRKKLNFYISKAFAVVVVTIWNFVLNFLYTF